MLGLGKTETAGAPVTASPARGQAIYQRHAAALYWQALLMLDDSARAETVVCDVIVDESALVPAQAWRCLIRRRNQWSEPQSRSAKTGGISCGHSDTSRPSSWQPLEPRLGC